MTDEQYNAICEHLQPTAEPGVKVLPLEGYKECINLLGSFDDETLEMARKLHKDLHPGQAFLKVMQLPIRDKLCTFCGSFAHPEEILAVRLSLSCTFTTRNMKILTIRV